MAHSDFDDLTQEFGDINVIPLVDVMLVLLTIILTTATFVVNGKIPVDLAKSTTASNAMPTTSYVLTITQDDQLYLNDQPIKNLNHALKTLDKNQALTIRADGNIALARFVSLSDDVKELGFSQVSLEVKR
ncbi:ExbD/TolR family protein [Moraxella lincolnii]|uniref:Biopolymer transporter ExbD n=1 Tax=Lwoffella lincolnii TaxID=90241 RepID=A0A1T0CKJ0_9GAMM|nr:biopolymer transporter ExbD [Moraxella lincolnii]OOS22769.1 hypothetical protein B0682_00685 [Moraxella lincolnii]